MAKGFNLTAQINLRGPTNLKPIVADIRRQLGSISTDVNVRLNPQTAKSISSITNRLKSMNDMLVTAKTNSDALGTSLSNLSSSLSSISNAGGKSATAISKTATSAKGAAQNIKQASTAMEEFGKQSYLAIKRFAAFSVVSGSIYKLVNAINTGFTAFINFDRQLVKLQQVTGKGTIGLKNLENQITNLATTLGVSSESLIEIASTLAQAGLNAEDTRVALSALAKTELAPSFDDLASTTEGAIAALRQFELQAGDLEAALGSINAVAAAFAVESSDIITAIQRTGGVFAAASKGVSQGKDALNEFIAVFTSIRATTRESAETIATGLRTIFTRIQRGKTIEALKEYGVVLTDLEGKFVGPYEAVKRLSEGLKILDPRDLRFSQIVEELGGFRQIGKVIPLIQQFGEAQKALRVAQTGQSSLTDAQVIAQKSLANQIAKVREQFLALIRDVGKSATFQAITKIVLSLTSAFISLASAFKPILPFLAILGTIKGVKALGEFGTGFFGSFKGGSGRPSVAKDLGTTVGSTISGAKEKEKAAATKLATDAISANTNAIKALTSAVIGLQNTIKLKSPGEFNNGGKVLRFQTGGIVPGRGKGDKVSALLEPGEVVINNKAADKYGRGNLTRMNKYAIGGPISIEELEKRSGSSSIKNAYSDTIQPKDKISGELNRKPLTVSPNDNQWNTVKKKAIGYYEQYKAKNPEASDKKLKDIASGDAFEDVISSLTGGTRTRPNYPVDVIGKRNPIEAKFTAKKTPKADLLSKLFRYRYEQNSLGQYDFTKDIDDNVFLGQLDVFEMGPGEKAKFKKLYAFAEGGRIQKFMAGSPGGIRVASGKGRGVKGSKGARSYIEPISSETYLKWAKDIYDEYDADPSLVMAAGPGGLKRPPEIALADMLLSQYALETGGAGLSVGQKFVRTPSANITDELRPYLVSDPSDPNELGFFKDDVVKFGKFKKIPQQVSAEISQRKTTSKMQRELFGFALEGVAKSVRDKTLTKKQLDTLSPDVLEALSKDPQSQVFSLPKLKAEAAPASSNLLDKIGGALSEFRKSGGKTNLSGVIPTEAAKQIKDTIPQYIKSISDEPQKVTKAKTALKYFDQFINGGTADKSAHATHFVETINQILKSGIVQGLAGGGQPEPGALVGGPFPSGAKSQQGLTWPEILRGIALKRKIELSGTDITIGGKRISLSKVLSPSQLKPNTMVGKAVGNDQKLITELSSFRKDILDAYLSGRTEVDQADPFNLTPEEIAKARKIAVVGLESNYASSSRRFYKKVRDIPFDVFLGSLEGNKNKEILSRLRQRDFASLQQAATEFIPGRPLADLNDQDLNRLGRANAEGYDLETILALLGATGGVSNARTRAVDFEGGLPSDLAALFSVPTNVFTQAKRTLSSDTISSALEGIADRLTGVRLAVGGKADGPGFEEVKKQIMDKYPEINFRISKRKPGRGFGYNIMAGLQGYSSVADFRQASSLQQLSATSDEMAQKILYDYGPKIDPTVLKKLQKKTTSRFAAGGLATPPTEQKEDKKQEKIFGKIGLRNTGSEITATYLKNSQREGMVTAKKSSGSLFTTGLSKATKGYGPRLYDIVMEAATSLGGMLTSDRNQVSDAAQAIWSYYFKNRSDVKKTPLEPDRWTKNTNYISPKLLGDKETWPPFTDEAWVLQSGYSKNPELINSPDVIDLNDPKYAAFIRQQQTSFFSHNSGGKISRFASGGTVPAMVSSGEAYVPPQLAKKIGYAKLNKMNQADRNGMRGFAGGGGISVFKGPGSGTSDSIGPVGLPQGSFIIREKATKTLGLNKGGTVGGIQKFFVGGVAEKDAQRAQGQVLSSVEEGSAAFAEIISQLPTALKDIILSKFKGIEKVVSGQAMSLVKGAPAFSEKTRGMAVASSKASAIGLQITGKKGGATTETVAHETGHLADMALGGGSNFASETQGTFQFELIAKIKKQMEDEFKKAGKSAEEIDKYLGTGKELFAEFFAKASPEVRAIITSTTDAKVGMEKLVDALGETGSTYAGLQASDLVPPKPKSKKSKQKDQFGYLKQQSKAIDEAKTGAVSFESLKPKTKTRKEAKQELDDSGLKALTTGIAQTSGEIAKLKAQTESLYQQSKNLDNQIGQYDQAILKIKSSTEEGAKGNKALNRIIQMKISAETQRLSVDEQAMASEEQLIALNQQKAQQIAAAKTFKAGGVPPGGGPPGGGGPSGPDLPKIDTTGKNPYADETAFIQYKARKEGMGEGEYRRSLATKIADKATGLQRDYSGRKEEFKQSLVARRESFQGIDKTTDVGQAQFNTAVAELAREIQDLNPELKFEDAKIAAEKLANDLAVTGDRARDVGSLMGELGDALPGEIDATKALELAKKQVAKQEGMSEGTLSRAVNPKEIQREQFIRSPEGQRFGKLAEFAPGLTQKFAGTKAGQALGKGADFISGKGGRFSKLFAGAGGFQGIGSGVAVGSEMLKNSGLVSKQSLKDPNVAGAFGAVQGAGVMGATGAELGGQLAGPVGALIGGVGGAIIGGIKGFFDAKNTQILTNALDKLTKSSEAVDVAFKELAKNDTDKNFKNVQKAFGQQIEASQELDAIAFGGGEGPSAGGVGGGALAGAAGGALIGTAIAGPIGTAIGGVLGGLVGGGVAYMAESQNQANREEALRNRAGSAGAMNESAARMAERQMGKMTTEQLGQANYGGPNIIAQQYKKSAIAAAEASSKTGELTSKQKEKIGQDAIETAYLDTYMKQRKEAGATDQQITEDILKDRKGALLAGKAASDAQAAELQKQKELARATKEVALATENLLDVYRRVGAKAQRFSDEVDDMLGGAQATISSLRGNASVQKVDRSGSERVLGNMAAYSTEEVKAATQEMVGKLGGGEEAQALGKQAEAAKFLQDRLPGMLRNENADPSQIMGDIRSEMSDMGMGGAAIDRMLGEIEKQISASQEGGLGTLADEISSGGIDKMSMTAAEAAKTLQNLSKTYNDTLQKSIDLQNQYNETIMQSNSYLRKAGSIRITAELDLAKALGNSPTLAQLNEPFDFEIKDLTKGLVAGGTTDPAAIAAGIVAKTEQNQALQESKTQIGNEGMQGVTAGDQGATLLKENQALDAAIGSNVIAINEGRQALEKLANDGTKAANALAKIEEQQRQIEGLGNRFEKIFTSGPEELFKMNKQSAALEAAQVAGADEFKSRSFRQDAFAGLEQDKEFLSTEEYGKQRGMLMRKSLEAQGYTGQSMIQKGGVNMSVDDFIKRIEGGMPNEEDPNVKAYKEAVDTQIKANEQLSKLEELNALKIQESMLSLQGFLATELPRILTDAVAQSKADAETKPETKSEPSKAQTTKAEAEKEKEDARKKKEELDIQVRDKESEVREAEGNIGWTRGASMDFRIKKRELTELKAQRDQQVQAETAATEKSKQADAAIEEEKKVKDQAKAAQAAEEKKVKETKVSSSIEQSQRVREGMSPPSIPVSPAPGSVQAKIQQDLETIRARQKTLATELPNPQVQTTEQQVSTGFAAPLTLDNINKPQPPQPVPSNLPKPVEYNRQVQAAETGATSQAGAKPTETSAQLLSLDPTSLEGLNTFNTNFGTYVDKLVNFQFPTIPEKIEMVGNHVVDVRVSGAAAFDSLQKGMKDLINKSIDEKMSEIWKQTGGALGLRPGAPSPKGK